MSLRSLYYRVLSLAQSIEPWIRKSVTYFGELWNIYRKRNLYSSVTLSTEEKKKIDEYYKKYYGKKVSHKWHRLYQSYEGVFDECYFPEILYTTKLEPKLNPANYAKVLGDKNLCNLICENIEGIRCPKTYLSCIYGTWRDGANHILKEEEAKSIVFDIGECVIKKSIDTDSGRDVMMCNISDGVDIKSNLPISKIFAEMGENFIVQERIQQYDALSAIYPDALNTFRVITYIADGDIHTAPLVMKMGRNGADKDNMHYGGISIGVSDTGILKKVAYSEYQERFTKHPDTGVLLEGSVIDKVPNILDSAKKIHARIPWLKIISYDLGLDKDGVVVLIEINPRGQSTWYPQMVNGQSLFGEHTAEMLSFIR